jgi:hypothetical protein
MGNKIVCFVCANQTGGFCSFKKTKMKLNKRRLCDKFKYDITKVKIKHPVPTIKRSDDYWRKDELKKQRKQELEVLKKEVKEAKGIQMLGAGNSKHPLTGDLSRFITTANTPEKE